MNKDLIADHIIHNSSLIFFVMQKDGKIIEYNDFTEKIVGPENLNTIKDIIIDFNNHFSLDKITLNGKKIKLSINLKSLDPGTFTFTFQENGDKIFAFGESDPEENQNLQKEMLKLNDEYADLTRELYKKNSELQKLNDLKNQFLGIAAHDLRNPIGNIISIASLLHDELYEKLNPKEKKFLTVIADLGEFGLNLLNDLLEISRIESNRKKLEVYKADPNVLIREIIKFNKYYADSQKVTLIFKSSGRIQPIMTNKQAFHQILNNLISNAIKYSRENTKVEVGIIPGEKNHTFYVKDEGPGIPAEEQDKLFKPFSKTSLKPRGDEKSTGLGLWIVNMLVRSHSGNIWLESSEGRGTMIFFSIPSER